MTDGSGRKGKKKVKLTYEQKRDAISRLPESLQASVETVNKKLAKMDYRKIIDPRRVHTQKGDGRMYFPKNTNRLIRELERQTGQKSAKTIQFKTRRKILVPSGETNTTQRATVRTHMSEWVIMENGKVYARDRSITKSHVDKDDKFVAYFLVGSDVSEKNFRPVLRLDTKNPRIKNVPKEVIKLLAPSYAIELEKRKVEREAEEKLRDNLVNGVVELETEQTPKKVIDALDKTRSLGGEFHRS